MKKLIILIVCFTLLCGCTKINNDNINDIINSVVSSDNDRANQYRNGYKFYLPNNLSTIKIDDKNRGGEFWRKHVFMFKIPRLY
mgnify:CR=1 FL=1